MNRICIIILAICFIVGSSTVSFAMCGSCGMGAHEHEAQGESSETVKAEKVNNTICPISGEAIDMKNPTTYEHDGKVYNFCCPACIDEFKKDPEKYIKKIEKG